MRACFNQIHDEVLVFFNDITINKDITYCTTKLILILY